MTQIMTDPARELAELCQKLYNEAITQNGEDFIAAKFGVAVWSREFYEIMFSIFDRIKIVNEVISDLELDDDHKSDAIAHLDAINKAFGMNSMRHSWYNNGSAFVAPVNVQPIKMLSMAVRQRLSYPKLGADEINDVIAEIDMLLGWLVDQQLTEQDFIRQALIEGLERLRFRMSKFEWLGHGYAVASLRDVIAAYMVLERGGSDPITQPDAAAMMQKTGILIKSVYEKITVAKDAVEAGDLMLRAYGAATLAMKAYPGIAGLLTGP